MAIEGVDYAGSRPSPAGLFAAGKRFVVRYGGPGGAWKHLTAAEARALTAAGLSIVANAEGTASGLQGRSAGASWARSADQHFRQLGMPADRPIYLSVDFDVREGQWSAVAEALRGAASVLGAGRVGVYGGRRAIEWARRDRVAAWFWQTYAWSAGVWVPGNHIEQYRNGVSVAGGDVDLCRAKVADYGQWTVGTQPQPVEEDDMNTAQNNALADAWTASVALRTGGTAPASDVRAAGPVWLVEQIKEIKAVLGAVATRVDIDPAELAAIGAQARAGAQAGVAAALDDAALDAVADRLAARLPDADRAELVAAVREVFADAGSDTEGPGSGA